MVWLLILAFLQPDRDTLFLTLEESIEIALKTNLEISQSAELVESANYGVAAVRKGLGLKTDLNLDQSRTESYNSHGAKLSIYNDLPWGGRVGLITQIERDRSLYFDQCFNVFTTGLAVTQDLITENVKRLDEQQASAGLAMSNLNYELTRREIIYDVSVIFFDWLEASRILKIRESALMHAEALLATLREKLLRGLRVGGNIFEAETYLNQCKINLILARSRLLFKKQELLKFADINTSKEIMPFDILAMDSIDVSKMESAIPDHPRLRMYDESIRLNELAMRKLRRERSVRISVKLSADLTSSFTDLEEMNDNFMKDYSMGISASIPIFDRGVARDRERQLKHQAQSIAYSKDNLKNELEIEVDQAIDNLHLLSEAVALCMNTLKIAQSNVEVELDRFGKGLSQINDIIRAQDCYISTELDYIETIIAYKKVKVKIHLLTSSTGL
ncbi:TolC family protein [candidate division WOR-3 bacterium]|nr:TolC family protein [candidate division WOR-3 bacterium]